MCQHRAWFRRLLTLRDVLAICSNTSRLLHRIVAPLLVLLLVLGAQPPQASASSPSPAKRLQATLTQTSAHHQRVGFDVSVLAPAIPPIRVTRKVTLAQYRVGGESTLVLTPLTLFQSVSSLRTPALAEAAKDGGHSWIRHSQFSAQSLPDLLTVLGLTRLDSVTVRVTSGSASPTYTVTPRSGGGWSVIITTKRKNKVETVSTVTRRETGNQRVIQLARSAGIAAPSVSGRSVVIRYMLLPASAAITLPTSESALDLSTRYDLLEPDRYDAGRLETFSREILFAANRIAEASNRTVTGVELNKVLGTYHPHEYPGLTLTAVEGRLQLVLPLQDGVHVHCAQLVRFDYTTESMVFTEGPC
jgi:hypothetical protein